MSKNENQPWVEVEPGDEGEPECTVVHVAEVVLPACFTKEGRVPFGVVVPIGGGVIPGGQVQYPRGYFARPITLASPAEDRALLEELIYGRRAAPQPCVTRPAEATVERLQAAGDGMGVLVPEEEAAKPQDEIRLVQQVERLTRVLFEPYYGREVVEQEIMPYLPLHEESLLQLGLAATKRQEVLVRVKR